VKKRNMPRVDEKLIERGRELMRRLNEQVRDFVIAPALAKQAEVRRRKGGKKTAEKRARKRDKRIDKLRSERAKLLADNPKMKKVAIAAILSERGLGGKAAIEKLLRPKKSSERR